MAFNKNIIVGVSVTPEKGLEVAQIDFASRTVLKYGSRSLAYDNNRREIVDLDIFKETLQDLLMELSIPKNAEIVLNLPSVAFKVSDYPASLNSSQISGVVEEELFENVYFKENEAAIAMYELPNSTIQFKKVVYTAAQKTILIEIAMQIKDLGYKLASINTSVNSTLNALIYSDRINVAPDTSWVLLLVENNCCRIIPMLGKNYVDCFEEKIAIGEVLGDAENYATVVGAVSPILKNLPSQCLYVVSKTDVISAKELANTLKYGAQIIHQEANSYNQEALVDVVDGIEPSVSKKISLDIIGAAINYEFKPYSVAELNLFNEMLGDVYILEQPPVLRWRSLELVLSMANMVKAAIFVGIIIVLVFALLYFPLDQDLKKQEAKLKNLNTEIASIEKILKDNDNISTSMFDEGDEIRIGLIHNKGIYSYYTIVGTEIPKKLWLTALKLGSTTTIEGQADNLESVYSFFRNIKDYNPESAIKLQKLGLASSSSFTPISTDGTIDANDVLTSMNADFYEFRISDIKEEVVVEDKDNTKNKKAKKTSKKTSSVPRSRLSE